MGHAPGALRQARPRPPLSAFVDCFWIHEGYTGTHARERVLPTATTDVVFAMHGDGKIVTSVAGARSTGLVLETSRPFTAIGIHFKPGGGLPFFGMPMNELHNATVPLDAVWGDPAAATLADRLWDTKAPDQRFRILEDVLETRAGHRLERHPAIDYALSLMDRSNGGRAVGDIVQRIGMSPRRFFDLFQSQVGLSPKVFCRIRRFAAVLKQIERAAEVDWTNIALACGYFDQAHFNHDFRAFAGVSPSAYLRYRTSRTHVAIVE